MAKRILAIALMIFSAIHWVSAQELYVFSEPASNMPTKSVGIRLTNEGMFNNPDFVSRTIPEIMFGFNKNFMMHGQAFLSDMDGKYRLEGGSLYAKYRFLSLDEAQSHFRAAAFGRISTSKRPTFTRDINLEGDNSGIQGGLVFTQLLHKLALSATLGYAHAFKDADKQIVGMPQPNNMFSYSLSSGYLVLPFVYKSYKEPNFNVYLELLGKTDPSTGQSYMDIAPAIQMIINSQTRIDLGYRFQTFGNIENRYTKNMYLLRAEFNFFNVLK
ncbi:hypothetical protein ACJVDH_20455 [Pedobacter sp. AW1-32]|uniref:hypothetical protein n=1 Tax=Pedobacter sp. AW1-32 TaxID=3383026 RepID=UPI003FEF4803